MITTQDLSFFERWFSIPVFALIYFLLELYRPLHRQKSTSKPTDKYLDIFWFFLTPKIADSVVVAVKFLLSFTFLRFINNTTSPLIDASPITAVFISIFWIDFFSYVAHYMLHRFGFLWKLHRLHHSAKELSIRNGFRNYWLEDIFFNLMSGSYVFVVAVPNEYLLLIELYRTHNNIVTHANVKYNLGIFQKWIVTSSTHHWHHSRENILKYGQNFGSYSLIWDRLLGTIYLPEHINGPEVYGIKEDRDANGIYMRFFEPFMSQEKYNHLKNKVIRFIPFCA